jgi:Uma2 family endonuclease
MAEPATRRMTLDEFLVSDDGTDRRYELRDGTIAAIDWQIKIPNYRRISSVMEILLIDSESAFAEVHRREGDRWITEMMCGIDAALALNSVPLTILLSELYEGISLPGPPTPGPRHVLMRTPGSISTPKRSGPAA